MELFVFIDDVGVPLEPVKTQTAIKKPQPEPGQEIIKPTGAPHPKTQGPEIVEPIKEAKEELVEESKQEPMKVEPNTQPSAESKEVLFDPPESSVTERHDDVSPEGGAIGMASGVGTQSLVGHNIVGSDTGALIETKFGTSVAPAFLHREIPIYPLIARKLGREGRVMLKLTINERGDLSDVEVIDRAGYGFTEAAVEAVKKSTFLPAKKDGKPIASRALLPIRFQLERN